MLADSKNIKILGLRVWFLPHFYHCCRHIDLHIYVHINVCLNMPRWVYITCMYACKLLDSNTLLQV